MTEERIFLDEISDILKMNCGRRSFVKTLLLGGAGAAFSPLASASLLPSAKIDAGKSTVSFVSGSDRRDMMYQALKPLESDIKRGIRGKQVIIKPNLVGNETIDALTHPDAIRGILDFLKPIYDRQVLIAESTGRQYDDMPGTIKHFTLFGYYPLENEYNVKLVDLNAQTYTVEWLLGGEGHPLDIRIIDPFLDQNNYFISVCRPKTHNCMVITLSAKNMLMAAPLVGGPKNTSGESGRHDKSRMHTPGIRIMNYNFFLLAQKVQPQLAVIDGLEGMEGNGPNNGNVVNHGVAIASTDFIAADRIASQIMGVDFSDIGYLTYCANAGIGQSDLSKIKIIGPDTAGYVKKYRMHDNFQGSEPGSGQLDWKY